MTWTEEQQRRYDEYMAELDRPAPPSRRRGPRPPTVNAGPGRVSVTRLDAEGNPTGQSHEIGLADIEWRLEDREMPRIDWGRINSDMRRAGERLRDAFQRQTISINIPALDTEQIQRMTGTRLSAGTHEGIDDITREDWPE